MPDLHKRGFPHVTKGISYRQSVHLLIGRFSVRVRAEEQVRGTIGRRWFTISSPSALWKAHRAERAAQRAYLRHIARHDVSHLDRLDWSPEMLDRLAVDVFGPR